MHLLKAVIQSIHRHDPSWCTTLLFWTRALNNVKERQQILLNPGITKWNHCREFKATAAFMSVYFFTYALLNLFYDHDQFCDPRLFYFFHHNPKLSLIIFCIYAPALVHNATMPSEAVARTVWNVICNGIPLSSFTQRVRQVFSLDMKASGDACQSWLPMMMAWGKKTASIPLTWKLWVSALLWC